jgi:hypothetical protein
MFNEIQDINLWMEKKHTLVKKIIDIEDLTVLEITDLYL